MGRFFYVWLKCLTKYVADFFDVLDFFRMQIFDKQKRFFYNKKAPNGGDFICGAGDRTWTYDPLITKDSTVYNLQQSATKIKRITAVFVVFYDCS